MTYKIVSDGQKFRVMAKKNWYSRYHYVHHDDWISTRGPITYDTLALAEADVKKWISADIARNKKWTKVKIVSINNLEALLYEKDE